MVRKKQGNRRRQNPPRSSTAPGNSLWIYKWREIRAALWWVTLSLHPTWSACDIKPIKGQYDIVHETRQHTAMLPEKNNATAIGNMHRKFGEVWISSGDTYAKLIDTKLIDTFHFSQRHLY